MANANAKADPQTASAALPTGTDIPEGFEQLGGSYAPTWQPEVGDHMVAEVTSPVREVKMKIGRRETVRRVIEVTTGGGDRFSVWESATLVPMFNEVESVGPGAVYWIRFDGLGKKKEGQNPPKLFTVAKAKNK